jgi:protein arginine kinase
MLHLVGLVMTNQIESALAALGNFGLVVRGAYGEHSPHIGDLYQISNEVTLGRTEEELIQLLDEVVNQIIERELQAREILFAQARVKCEDAILRAVGVLTHARSIDSQEAVMLLSRVRLGVDRDYGIRLSHEQLNRLMIDIQPAHLARLAPESTGSDERDAVRAQVLRRRLNNGAEDERN